MKKLIEAGLTITLISSLGCGGGGHGGGGQGLPTAVTVSATQTSLEPSESVVITAFVSHLHGQSDAVTWSLTGPTCPKNCGALSSTTLNPVTYTAPQNSSASFQVTVTATSVADSTATGSVTLKIQACPSGTRRR